VFLHAGQRHLELIRQTGDRGVRPAKLIDDPAARRIGERRKREIEGRIYILNHMVQYVDYSRRKRKRPERPCRGPDSSGADTYRSDSTI
jgi:hypothetical protein